MKTYLERTKAFIRDEEGASAIEYALLVALIALGIAGALTTFSGKISSLFNAAGSKLDQAST
jgi:pilus assembly protein Flp/PilA